MTNKMKKKNNRQKGDDEERSGVKPPAMSLKIFNPARRYAFVVA
jgi:hypothetical protein